MKTKQEIEKGGFLVTFTNGSGAGGQKRNRTYSVAVVKHLDSGIVQRCDETRNANKNMNIAYETIIKSLGNSKELAKLEAMNELRKKAMENTIRTYNFKRGIVKNHLTGKEANLNKVLDGKIDLIQ